MRRAKQQHPNVYGASPCSSEHSAPDSDDLNFIDDRSLSDFSAAYESAEESDTHSDGELHLTDDM